MFLRNLESVNKSAINAVFKGIKGDKGFVFFFFVLPQNGKQYLLLYSLSMDNRTIFHSFNFLIYYLFFLALFGRCFYINRINILRKKGATFAFFFFIKVINSHANVDLTYF